MQISELKSDGKKRKRLINGLHRFTALFMSLCMLLSVFSQIDVFTLTAEAADTRAADAAGTQGATRQADPSTMDAYTKMLDFSKNTRYAGRLWSDKTVFAYGDENSIDAIMATKEGRQFDGKTLTLTDELDGISGSIELNDENSGKDEDFLEVYSVLGSSLQITEKGTPPVDLVILLDMSGSMLTDTKCTNNNHTDDGGGLSETGRIEHSRMYATITAINSAIDTLMAHNSTNKVAVVAYGATAAELVPLGHYQKIDNKPYLTMESITDYGVNTFGNDYGGYKKTGTGEYTVRFNATRTDGNNPNTTTTRSVCNSYRAKDGATIVGYNTDMQAGIYLGFQQLYNAYKTPDDVTYTYTSMINGNTSTTIPRVPAFICMTDGGSNYALSNGASKTPNGNEWYDLSSGLKNYNASGGYNNNYKKYRAETDNVNHNNSGVVLDILLTASFMKSKVFNLYSSLIEDSKVADNLKQTLRFPIYTVSVDTPDANNWQIPRIYGTLNPKTYFNSNPPQYTSGYDAEGNPIKQNINHKADITNAYARWNDWLKLNPGEHVDGNVYESDNSIGQTTFPINALPAGGYTDKVSEDLTVTVTKEDVQNNIFYNDNFYDIGSADIEGIYSEILDAVTTPMFSPVAGGNDLGLGDSVTYMDPVGKYMEIKDIKSLLLFGELHPIRKTALYDYHFIQEYGETAFGDGGWFRRNPDTGTIEKYPDPDSSPAWEDGYNYYVSREIAGEFLPPEFRANIADETSAVNNTVYTFYRFDAAYDEHGNVIQDVNEQLHMNPVYGDKVPDTVTYKDDGSHKNTPGVYAFNDVRIWVANSGEYSDPDMEGGGMVTDSNFDEALYIDLPVNMLPMRTVTLTQNSDDSWNYVPNQEIEDKSEPAYKASFPLRVFYTVGMQTDALSDGYVDVAGAISPEYIKDNKTTALAAGAKARNILENNDPDSPIEGALEFFANWYNPMERYSEYAINSTDYTYGNAAITF